MSLSSSPNSLGVVLLSFGVLSSSVKPKSLVASVISASLTILVPWKAGFTIKLISLLTLAPAGRLSITVVAVASQPLATFGAAAAG